MKKILIIVAIVIVTIVVAIALVISPIAKRYIEKNSKELIGRQVTMDKLRINIFSGGIKMVGFAMEAQPGEDAANFVELDSLTTRIRILPMISSRFIINKMHLSGLRVNVWQEGSKFNFDDIIAKFASDSTDVKADSDEPSSWEIGIYDIRLRSSRVQYRDIAVGSDFDMNNISLDIPGVYFSDKSTDMGLNLTFAKGGELKTKMSYDMSSSQYKLNLQFKDYDIAAILPYVRQSFNVGELSGLMTTNVDVVGDIDHVMEINVSGLVQVNDLNVLNDDRVKLLGANVIKTSIGQLQLSSQRYMLDSLMIDGFSTLFEIYPNEKNNFSTLFKTETQGDSTTVATQDSTVVNFEIGLLSVNGGQLQIIDNVVPNKFDYLISNISINAANFGFDKKNNVNVSALMNGSGKAALMWKGDMQDMTNQNISVRLSNVDLKALTPYMMEYFAYPMNSGTLSFTSQNIITGGMLRGTNHLQAYKVEVGKKDKTVKPEYKIPFKTVLYVLKDKKDMIDMSLPVSGNIKSPEFSYRKIIIKTMLNLMVKVATAPLSFMGDALGINKGANLQQLVFIASQRDFSLDQYAKLKEIAAAIKSHGQLTMTFTQMINYQSAIQGIATRELKKNFYLYRNPTKIDALETIDYEAIKNIPDKDPALILFADSLAGVNQINTTLALKAMTIYGADAQSLLSSSLQRLDDRLREYMIREGVPAANVVIVPQTVDQMKLNNGRTMYTISVGLAGEDTAQITQESVADSMAVNHPDSIISPKL